MSNSLNGNISRLSASDRLEAFASAAGMIRAGEEDYEYIVVDF